MLCFGFVSGHDFSRAIQERKRIGLQPLPALKGQSRGIMLAAARYPRPPLKQSSSLERQFERQLYQARIVYSGLDIAESRLAHIVHGYTKL